MITTTGAAPHRSPHLSRGWRLPRPILSCSHRAARRQGVGHGVHVRGAQDESLAAATRQESEYSSVELIELLELSSDIASESKASEGCDCVRSIRSRSAHDEV